jgi:hypothetical protein
MEQKNVTLDLKEKAKSEQTLKILKPSRSLPLKN